MSQLTTPRYSISAPGSAEVAEVDYKWLRRTEGLGKFQVHEIRVGRVPFWRAADGVVLALYGERPLPLPEDIIIPGVDV